MPPASQDWHTHKNSMFADGIIYVFYIYIFIHRQDGSTADIRRLNKIYTS